MKQHSTLSVYEDAAANYYEDILRCSSPSIAFLDLSVR